MSRVEADLVGGILSGLHWRDAAARAGIPEERARQFLESIRRFAASVGEVTDFVEVPPGITATRPPQSGDSPTAKLSTPKAATAGDSPTRSLIVWSDGASLGNPGSAGAGALITTSDGETVDTVSEYIGRATNNVAEYEAVRMGLESAVAHGARIVELRMDSELVARQLTGRYKVRDPRLREKYLEVTALIGRLDDVIIRHVPRSENAEADRLARRGAKQGGEGVVRG